MSTTLCSETQRVSSGHIYIVRLRESIRLKENVYKCGRTKNMIQRIKTYPLGTELLYCVQVSDMFSFEQLMLSHFRENFTPIPEMGAEYFKGNLLEMIKLLNTHLPFHLPNHVHHNHKDDDSQSEDENMDVVIEPGLPIQEKKKDVIEIKKKNKKDVKLTDETDSKKKNKDDVKLTDETDSKKKNKKDLKLSDETDSKKKNKDETKTSVESIKKDEVNVIHKEINDVFYYKNKYHCRYNNSIIHKSYTKTQLMKKFKMSESTVQDIQTKTFDESRIQLPYHICYGYFDDLDKHQYIDFKTKSIHNDPLYTIIYDENNDMELKSENKVDQQFIENLIQQYVSKEQLESFVKLYQHMFVSCEKGYVYSDAGLQTYSLLEWLTSLTMINDYTVIMKYKNKQEFDSELSKSLRKIKPSTRLIVVPILDQNCEEVIQKVHKINPKCNIAFSNRSKKYKSPYSIKKLTKIITKEVQIKLFTIAIKKEEFNEEYVRFIFECDPTMCAAMFWWFFNKL
jgi:hypothetical protein